MEDLLCVKKIDIFQLCSYPCEGKRVVKTAKHGKIFREGNLRPHYHVGAIRLGLNGRITGGGKKLPLFGRLQRTLSFQHKPSLASNMKREYILELEADLMRRDSGRHPPKILENKIS